MTEHVSEDKLPTGPSFKKDPITVDPDVLSMSGQQAFEWLFGHFCDYMHNKLAWYEVRNILATARGWKEMNENTDMSPWEKVEFKHKKKEELSQRTGTPKEKTDAPNVNIGYPVTMVGEIRNR